MSYFKEFFEHPLFIQVVFVLVYSIGGWILALIIKRSIYRLISSENIGLKFTRSLGMEDEENRSLAHTLADIFFYTTLIIPAIAILDQLELHSLLNPLQELSQNLLSFFPRLLSAVLVLALGWAIAKISSLIVSRTLSAVGVDKFTERFGSNRVLGTQKLSSLIALILYIILIFPFIIAAFGKLKLDAITQPATNMLDKIFTTVPRLAAAGFVLGIAFILAKFVSGLATNLLAGMGFDNVIRLLGFERSKEGSKSPSEIVGYILLIVVMLLFSVEALDLLKFTQLSVVLKLFIAYLGKIFLGVVVFGFGLFFSNVVSKGILNGKGEYARVLAFVAKVSILTLTGAMALGQLGVGEEIIRMAFTLILGALAVAFAVAFGVGGRETAGKIVHNLYENLREKKNEN